MKKREWFLFIFLPLIITWGLDRITKIWAETIIGFESLGIIGFVLHHNHGAILGLFSDLPSVLRIVSLATGGAFLLFSFFIIQYLLPSRSPKLRIGLSILIGGIIGNVSDRILYGYVIDFLVFKCQSWMSPAMNVADILQWVGYFLIVAALLQEGKIFWPEENSRKSYWINVRFQIKYCLTIMAFGLFASIISGTFSYTYMRVTISDLVGQNPAIIEKFLIPYAITFSIISLGFSMMLFLVGLVLSHRSAGPIYAFELFLKDLSHGKFRPFRLRTKDEFMHLEKIAEELSEKFRKNYSFQVQEIQDSAAEESTEETT